MKELDCHRRARACLCSMLVALAGWLVPHNAFAGTGSITGTLPGPTPFISYVNAVYDGGTLQSVSYEILPRNGSLTRPLIASYSAQYLASIGALQDGSNSVTIPVFGLYANFTNTVYITFSFSDGTADTQLALISTARYRDPCVNLSAPTLIQNRTATSDLAFDYMLLREQCSPTVLAIVDTDGNIRWVGQANQRAFALALSNNGIYLTDGNTGMLRMELTTGAATTIGDYAGPPYNVTNAGQNSIDPGRDGIIVAVDTTTQTGAVDLEIDPSTGAVLNSWDLGQIISYTMTTGGVNPANFVKGATADWFHDNATAYNPADNTLIVSSRENFVVAVDYDTPPDGQKKIHWILGDTSKAWYQYPSLQALALTPTDGITWPPIGQHAVSIDHNGLLLLFDNGAASIVQNPAGISRTYTAVREYAIDAAARTVTAGNVYYSPAPPIFNRFCGGVYDVNGTYLAVFPNVSGGSSTVLQGLDSSQHVVFDLRYPGNDCGNGWNAYPIRSNVFVFSGPAASPGFDITLSQFGLALDAAHSGQVDVSVTPRNGFTGSVAFTATGFPAGVTWSFSPAGSTTGSTLDIAVGAGTAPGNYPITVTGTSGALVGSVFLNLTVRGATTTSASFVRTDTTTQGNWQGTYGHDGYTVVNNASVSPSYAVVTATGEQSWTWANSLSILNDVRALQKVPFTTRIAATWYGENFSIDVNLIDGQPHQVAVYLLDWDGLGRAETVKVLDAATHAELDSRAVSTFTAGKYLVWSVTGHVILQVTRTGGQNAVVSGLFFDPPSATVDTPPTVVLTSPAAGASPYVAPASISLSATASPTTSSGTIAAVAFYEGTNLVATSTSTSNPYTAMWSGVQPGTYVVTAKAYSDTGAFAFSAPVSVTVNGPAAAASATYVGLDTTTQGTWQGVYGADGYTVVNNATSNPSYAGVTPSGQASWIWAGSTTDVRALQTIPGPSRIAATYYSPTTFSIDVNLTGGTPHRVTLYALDFDAAGRSETIQVLDSASLAVLDTQTVSGFSGGQYVTWSITGHVIFRVTRVAGPNAVLSGLFFDPPGGTTAHLAPTATLTQPTAATPFTAPATVNFGASVTTYDGATVTQVAYFEGASQRAIWNGVDANYQAQWIGVAAGPHVLTVHVTDSLGKTTISSPVTIDVAPAGGASTLASFVTTDAATKGNWSPGYGTDGYLIVNHQTNVPGYATVGITGAASWTWNGATADIQALRRGTSPTDRIAATLYSPTTFSLDVTVTDGATHRVALYVLDYDGAGRVETIEVLNAATGAVIDSRTVNAFAGGQYWVYRVSGHVILRVTRVAGPNAVLSGLFFDPDGGGGGTHPAPTATLTQPTAATPFTAPATVTFSASIATYDAATVTQVAYFEDASQRAVWNGTDTNYQAQWTGVAQGQHVLTVRVTDSLGGTTISSPVTINVAPAGGASPLVSFVTTDAATKGNWSPGYGTNGYVIVNDQTSIPSYANVVITGASSWTWNSSTPATQALRKATSPTDRVAATLYSPTTFSLDVTVNDAATHRVALYLLDYDALGRVETIDVLDGAGNVLDSKTVNAFSGGQYWVYQVSGHVVFRITRLAGPNAVLSGIFFDVP